MSKSMVMENKYKKINKSESNKSQVKTVNTVARKLGVSTKTFLTLLGVAVATGGSYGGYTIYKGTTNLDQAPVYMSQVIDGDTFVLETGEKIRLSEIDAPETEQCGGDVAKLALEKLLQGRALRLEKDLEGQDKYDRLVRYVIALDDDPRVGNTFVNKYMIEKGLATYQRGMDIKYQGELREAEKLAKTKIVGVWKDCPEIFAKSPSYIADQGIPPPNKKCIIKGNISPNGYGKVYLVPGCPNYERTAVQPAKGEEYFCSEAEAEKQGYVKAANCK